MSLCIYCGKEQALENRMLGPKCYQKGKLEMELENREVIRKNKEQAAKEQKKS